MGGSGEERSGVRRLVHRHTLVRMESERAVEEHPGRKITHDRFSLYMEVAEHLIGPPAAEEFDDVRVYLCAEECHCASGAQGSS